MTYTSCEGDIRTDSSGNWWHCSTGFDELSQAEFEFIAQQTQSSTELSSESVERLAAAIEQFNQVMVDLFTFDPVLFSTVLFGCIILFAKGWGAGVVARLLGKK
ncbi:hypothetical protein [Pontibacterium sp.]|uniref:hypothetical protein n=1 Tax=Pontibacterium sp. TaxID=2036026 RepID=UPI003561D942